MSITGSELVRVVGVTPSGTPAGQDQITTTGAIAGLAATASIALNFSKQYATNSATASTTLLAANVSGTPDCTLNMNGAINLGATATPPTVASVVANIPGATAGMVWRLRIINGGTGTATWTVGATTGWTLNGTMTIATATYRDFYATLSTSTAIALQSIGTGTNS